MRTDYVIIGAGFAGSILAERIASQLNKKVLIIEKRAHIGGNAYDEYDEHEILVHKYGPHIFHTNDRKVFEYLSYFTKWRHYEHKVLANYRGELYPIPINRITINKLFGKNYSHDEEIVKVYESVKERRIPVLNSEDIIVNQIGYDLFDKFYRTYTKKQWGLEPKDLAPSVCGRIPVRTNEDCRYFLDKYQFIPQDGYTKMFEKMLSNKNIQLILNTDYKTIQNNVLFDKMVYTGPLDYFFDYEFGKLGYRSIHFEYETFKQPFFQSCAQVNYVDDSVKYTRVIEHKYLSGNATQFTTISREYPQINGEPFYPIPTESNRHIHMKYKEKALKLNNIIFCGRLAEYQYYNMDQVVANTLRIFEHEKSR